METGNDIASFPVFVCAFYWAKASPKGFNSTVISFKNTGTGLWLDIL